MNILVSNFTICRYKFSVAEKRSAEDIFIQGYIFTIIHIGTYARALQSTRSLQDFSGDLKVLKQNSTMFNVYMILYQ